MKKMMNINFKILMIVLMAFLSNGCSKKENTFTVNSPNGNLSVKFSDENGTITYTLLSEGKEIIYPSELSILPDSPAQINSAKYYRYVF